MTQVDSYLNNRALRALENSLALIAEILKFHILELWIKVGDEISCEYIYGTEETVRRFPWLKFGYHPRRAGTPAILEKMRILNKSEQKYLWSDDVQSDSKLAPPEFKSKSELSYLILPDKTAKAERSNILLLGFSTESLPSTVSKLKFLGGLGSAIATAFYEFEDTESDEEGLHGEGVELDEKKFAPSKPLIPSSAMLSNIVDPADPASNPSLGVWGRNLSDANLALYGDGNVGLDYIDYDAEENFYDDDEDLFCKSFHTDNHEAANDSTVATENSDTSSHLTIAIEKAAAPADVVKPEKKTPPLVPKLMLASSGSTANLFSARDSRGPTPRSGRGRGSGGGFNSARSARSDINTARSVVAPTWQPTAPFSFPVAEIPAKQFISDELTLNDFSDVKHLADGSNSNIYLGRLNNQRVIIKMIKEKQQLNPTTIHEFDLEHGMLVRLQHPNIIKILGAGCYPRRFIVLEYLGGGTLNTLLVKNQTQPGLTSKLFRKPSFTYKELLTHGRGIADALDYLHRRCHIGATIIHRDLKPDNIGFSEDGSLKLFDFGLVTCVKQRQSLTESYRMTGFTGSLRYMAPEVALSAAYTEKVDVYSFGILLWQMARDRVPFKGLNKEEFMKSVVMDGERPKLDSSWPAEFSQLLTSCWNKESIKRPSFAEVVQDIDRMLYSLKAPQASVQQPQVPFLKAVGKQSTTPVKQSNWF